MATMRQTYRCVTCDRVADYEGPLPRLYPFCCERCRLADLGRWLREQYSIDRDLTPADFKDATDAQRHREE